MNHVSFDMIVKTISSGDFAFNSCNINMQAVKILSKAEKASASSSEIIFADIIKKKLKKLAIFPVALKVFVDLERLDKRNLNKKQLELYNSNIGSIIGLKYETSIYQSLYSLIKTNICPNFIPYVGYAECDKKNIIKSIPASKRDEFLDGLLFGDLPINLPINILITGRPSNSVPLSQFIIDENISQRDKHLVILQCLYTLYVLKEENIRHNDLHLGNILVSNYGKPVNRLYVVGENRENWFYINTSYVPLFFDWDLSYKQELGINKKINPDFCIDYNICSKPDPYFDSFTFLCILEDVYCSRISPKNKDAICDLSKLSGTKSFNEYWEEGFYCRAFKTLNLTEIQPIDTLIANKMFEQFRYKESDKIDDVYGYPKNVEKYIEQTRPKLPTPETTDTPVKPKKLLTPDTPVKPKKLLTPETTDTPLKPKKLLTPDTPVKPLTPETTNTPEKPKKLLTPDTPIDIIKGRELITAIIANKEKDVKRLIKEGVDVKKVIDTSTGNTSLIIASRLGNLNITRLLVEAEVDVDDEDASGKTALLIASNNGHLDIVRLLIRHGADVNHQDVNQLSSLSLAILKSELNPNALDIVKELINAKADVNHSDTRGVTALMYASFKGNIEIVKFLMEHDADMYLMDENGESAMILARRAGKDDIITYFVDLMKTPNTKTDDDENAKRKDKEEQDMLDRLQADRKRLEREGVLRDSVLNNKLIKNAIERIRNFYKK